MSDRALELWFLGSFLATQVLRAALVRRRPRGPRAQSRVIGRDRLLRIAGLFGAQILPVVYVVTPWLDRWDYALPDWAGLIGAGLAAACLWLLWLCHAALGRSWTHRVELHQDHALVTHGIYRHVRHPIYGKLILWGVAQLLLLQNWIVGPTGLVFALAFYLARVRREEAMLIDHFGDSYRRYMARTGRIWPRLSRPAAAPAPRDGRPPR